MLCEPTSDSVRCSCAWNMRFGRLSRHTATSLPVPENTTSGWAVPWSSNNYTWYDGKAGVLASKFYSDPSRRLIVNIFIYWKIIWANVPFGEILIITLLNAPSFYRLWARCCVWILNPASVMWQWIWQKAGIFASKFFNSGNPYTLFLSPYTRCKNIHN